MTIEVLNEHQACCLVLGGKGFIGSHVVRALVALGHTVRVLDRAGQAHDSLSGLDDQVQFIDGDFGDSETIRAALRGCQYCFHFISTTGPKSSNDDPAFDVETNIIRTIRLLEIACQERISKLIFVSSGGTVYGVPKYTPVDEAHPTDPSCSYGIAKLAIEKYLHLYRSLYGLDYLALRISNPFGEWQRTNSGQGAIAVFLGKALRDEPVEIWGDGSVIRDYIYIGDVIDAVIAAMTYKGEERVMNVGSGVPTSLLQVLNSIEAVTDKRIERCFMPKRAFDVPVSVLAIERAKRELGWSPKTSFQDGLTFMLDWHKKTQTTEFWNIFDLISEMASHNFLVHINYALDHYRDNVVSLSVTRNTKIQISANHIVDAIFLITCPCKVVLRRIKNVMWQGQ
jgi:UDP-glucose 4-epimerase